jgi:hypothetical protein
MANQMIALQARAPQTDILGGAIQRNAQMINMLSQQAAAQRQAAAAEQGLQIARTKEARDAAMAPAQQGKVEADAAAAQMKMVLDFFGLTVEGLKQARGPEDAVKIGDLLKSQFQSPALQQIVDQRLSSMPADPTQWGQWREQTMLQSLDTAKQLERQMTQQNLGTSTRMISTPKYGGGAASVVPGSEAEIAQEIAYVRMPDGTVTAQPKRFAPGGGARGSDTFDRMIGVESGGQQFDRSGKPLTSPAGAIGIAQVMPNTAPEAARLAGLPFDDNRYRNDPEYNRALGKAYYEKQLADFGDERLAAAAYNAGPDAVRRALRDGGPDGWINRVPRETQNYVNNIFGGASAAGAAGVSAQGSRVVPGSEGGTLAVEQQKQELKKAPARAQVSELVTKMRTAYQELQDARAIPTEKLQVGSNIGNYLMSTAGGRELRRAMGTEANKPLNDITSSRKLLATAIKNAAGMSAQEMNSNTELLLMLDALSDPTQGFESAMSQLDTIEQLYGKPKTPAPTASSAPATGPRVDALLKKYGG